VDTATLTSTLSYQGRIEHLRRRKMEQTREKQQVIGAMDYDDWAIILPPPELREVRQLMGPSGVPITDVLLKGFEPEINHPSGGFYGAAAVGRSFHRLLDTHPVYVDPVSSLAGAYMVNFFSYREPHWNPDYSYGHLEEEQRRYQLLHGIGGVQHFCQDLGIGLAAGWQELLSRVRRYRDEHRRAGTLDEPRREFYEGLEQVVLGFQSWVRRHAAAAREMAGREAHPELRRNLLEIAEINQRLVTEPPATFREACQWTLWYQLAARMYDNSGSLGRLDLYLLPYYQREIAARSLSEEEAVFHLACLLVRAADYIQLGGYTPEGIDDSNRLSYLILEATHRLRIPANVAVSVGAGIDPGLLKKGVENLFADRTGIPKFLGLDQLYEGFTRNGYPIEVARTRTYAGCHWFAIPGREYTLNDIVKVNLAAVLDVALRDLMRSQPQEASVELLWSYFERHLRRAVEVIALSIDFHMEHMHKVFPELVLDLLCYGPIERGRDVTGGGVEHYNFCVDGAALATAADSFAAIKRRIEEEKRLGWGELLEHLDGNWKGEKGQKARLLMRSIKRYGYGGTDGDELAVRIARLFGELVHEKRTPAGYRMIPGLFSWAATISLGKALGATPNGRGAGEPISFGSNPDPGFRKDGASTALAVAVASVQPGFGNPAPLQIELDPGFVKDEQGVETVARLLRTHFEMGGTEININVVDAAKVLEAHADPSKHPDLVVRVTGFSAYFASLSPELRQIVVDRIIRESGQ
jgi:pyruvate-formate lyase